MSITDKLENITLEEKTNGNEVKRKDYLPWDDYFMATALLAAQRSKDPVRQVGACIVDQNNVIVGIGYNGMPRGCSDDEFPWDKKTPSALDSKFLYVCHAEMNAIVNKSSASVADCKMYVSLVPCNECAKIIIQSGIKEVLYLTYPTPEKEGTVAALRMFKAAGVKYRLYRPTTSQIVLNLNKQ